MNITLDCADAHGQIICSFAWISNASEQKHRQCYSLWDDAFYEFLSSYLGTGAVPEVFFEDHAFVINHADGDAVIPLPDSAITILLQTLNANEVLEGAERGVSSRVWPGEIQVEGV